MIRTRVIPCLLLKDNGLVKTIKFKNAKYIGCPINAVKIFNDKEADELIFLDIAATLENREPPFRLISEIASECFMPFSYGGGINNVDDVKKIIVSGAEKVVINSYAIENPRFIREVSDILGAQSVVVSMDVKKSFFGKYEIYSHGGRRNTKLDPAYFAVTMQQEGAGEIFLNSIDRDGTMMGYDIDLLKIVTSSVDIPVIACGGAKSLSDLAFAVKEGGASAVSAGSMFVFYGPHRAVLINMPAPRELEEVLG